jgi:hypothetical protein
VVDFEAPANAVGRHQDVVISVHYEMLQGAPVLSKWISLSHASSTGGTNEGNTERKEEDEEGSNTTRAHTHTHNENHGHIHNHDHDRNHMARSSSSASVPTDQQGPVNIENCTVSLPPSNWEMEWVVDTPHQYIRTGASSASYCLTAVPGSAFHSYNDMLNALPCNASAPTQKWFINKDGKIQSLMTSAQLKAVGENWIKCNVNSVSAGCCVDVNNHQSDPGTVLQGEGCAASTSWHVINTSSTADTSTSSTGSNKEVRSTKALRLRRLFGDAAGTTLANVKLEAAQYPGMCMTYTPMQPPPPPPPPPPPNLPCDDANGCSVVNHATIEVVRLNGHGALPSLSTSSP